MTDAASQSPEDAACAGSVTGSGDATATGAWAIANSGYLMVNQPSPPPPEWPVPPVGYVPAPASAFQTRTGLRERVQRTRARSAGAVLIGGGGVGKSQLAASYAHEAISGRTDLVVWVDAAAPGAVIAAYAKAAARVQAPGATGQPTDAEADARMFLEWAVGTERSWLVVLDDVTDPSQLAGWWPASDTGTGWVLATTRRREADLTGSGRVPVDVDVYIADESAAYLSERLADEQRAHLLDEQAGSLAEALGHLPLALSHAAAYMINQRLGCAAYLERYKAGQERLDQLMPGDPDGHGRQPDGHRRSITVTLLLSLDAADMSDPVGLARPAIALAAVLDPAGHPEALWASDAVTSYLTSHRTPPARPGQPAARPRIRFFGWRGNQDSVSMEKAVPVTPGQARAAVVLLDRYCLATFDEGAGPRAVRVHSLTARAARETAPAGQLPRITRVAADAVAALWPYADYTQPDLVTVLRANAGVLYDHGGEALWQSGLHPLLQRAGLSLADAGLQTAAIAYWQRTIGDALRVLGSEHPDTLRMQARLATAYSNSWVSRTAEAIPIFETVIPAMTRILGPGDPDTLDTQAQLVQSYAKAERAAEAVALGETVAAAAMQILGPEHRSTLTAQVALGLSYRVIGRTADAIALQERVATMMTEILGPEHPNTLSAQATLAISYAADGRTADAITLLERAVAGMARVIGPEHLYTLVSEAFLVPMYAAAGRSVEAVARGEAVAAATARIQGPGHPDTLIAQGNLALAYCGAGRPTDAIILGETVTAARARIQGPEHPDTLAMQAILGNSYRLANRTAEAITNDEQVAALTLLSLGPEHQDTLAAQGSLALSYTTAGRFADAITLLEPVIPEMVRILGPEHLETLGAQFNLGCCYAAYGRAADAITLLEPVIPAMLRVLSPGAARFAQKSLAVSYYATGRVADAVKLITKAKVSQWMHLRRR